MDKKIGHYSFVIGTVIAIFLGLLSESNILEGVDHWLWSILIVLGLIVGLLNVTGKETREFLFVSLVLVVVAFAGNGSTVLLGVQALGPFLSGIFAALLNFIIPASIVVGLKDIWNLGKNE